MKITQIDAFTDRAFGGNPAAVCLLAEFPPDDWMQRLAAEMNLSETAFLVPSEDRFRLRWFTPAVEVDLCGHATLASAHFLWESGRVDRSLAVQFETASGMLQAELHRPWIEMDFPSQPPKPVDDAPGLISALGVEPLYVGRNRSDYLVEVEDEAEVRRVQPDMAALAAETDRGVIVTSRAEGAEYQIVSRFFAPAVGIDEDPVTGSAHCCLGPFWAERLGKETLVGYQASARGGFVRMTPRGDRIGLAGRAVTVFEAELSPSFLP